MIHALDLNPDGFPVVLLHGLGSNGSAWGLQFPALIEQGFRVLAPDLPGFGRSSHLGESASVAHMAERLMEWTAGIGVHSAHLVGLSLGGVVALQIALDYPDWLRKLVLVNAFARFEPATTSTWFYMLKRFLLLQLVGLDAQAQAVAKHVFPDPCDESYRLELQKQILQSDPKAYRSTMRNLVKFDVMDRLPAIRVPTLVVSGEQDQTVPLRVQSRLAGGITAARHVVIPGSGHAAPVQKPEQFNQILIDFLLEIS